MRPINLIPQEERRSRSTVTRSGPLAYLIVGALAVLLAGVVMLVLTSNQISDHESEATRLNVEKAAATAQAERFAPYVAFHNLTEQRFAAITALANSRFDWPRVIKELSLVLPSDVYFTNLSGSAGGGIGGEGEGAGTILGPSLEIKGCAPGQEVVAGFVATLKQVDGVTRVGLLKSVLGVSKGETTGTSPCSVGVKDQFEIVVAFDAAPSSPDSSGAIAEATAESPEEGSEAEGSESESADSEPTKSAESESASTSSTAPEPTG